MLRRIIPSLNRFTFARYITNLKISKKEDSYILPAIVAQENLAAVFHNNIPEFHYPLEIPGSRFGVALEIAEVGEVSVEAPDNGEVTRWPVSPIIVIDVRNPNELDYSIKQSDNVKWFNIPLPEFTTRYDKEIVPVMSALEASSGEEPTIFLYCMKGIRSMKAAEYLAKHRGVKAVSVGDGLSTVPQDWKVKQ